MAWRLVALVDIVVVFLLSANAYCHSIQTDIHPADPRFSITRHEYTGSVLLNGQTVWQRSAIHGPYFDEEYFQISGITVVVFSFSIGNSYSGREMVVVDRQENISIYNIGHTSNIIQIGHHLIIEKPRGLGSEGSLFLFDGNNIITLPSLPAIDYRTVDYIRELQTRLLDQEFDPGPIDGILGPMTQRAMLEFVEHSTGSPSCPRAGCIYLAARELGMQEMNWRIGDGVQTFLMPDDPPWPYSLYKADVRFQGIPAPIVLDRLSNYEIERIERNWSTLRFSALDINFGGHFVLKTVGLGTGVAGAVLVDTLSGIAHPGPVGGCPAPSSPDDREIRTMPGIEANGAENSGWFYSHPESRLMAVLTCDTGSLQWLVRYFIWEDGGFVELASAPIGQPHLVDLGPGNADGPVIPGVVEEPDVATLPENEEDSGDREQDGGDLPQQQMPSIASLPEDIEPQSTGSGVFINEQGFLVTAAHVVDDCSVILINGAGLPSASPVSILTVDQEMDLAVLRSDLNGVGYSSIRSGGTIRLGEDVIAAGFPLSGILAPSMNVTTGIISSVAGVGGDRQMLQVTAPLQPGNSGGPLLDRSGNLIGIVVAKLDWINIASEIGDIPENVNFAVKSQLVEALLVTEGIDYTETPLGEPLATTEIAEIAEEITLRVECWN